MPAVSQNADLDPSLVIIVGPGESNSTTGEAFESYLAYVERLCHDGETEASPLRQMLGIILGDEVSEVSSRVTPGFARGIKVPWITIDLGRSRDAGGGSLAGRLDHEQAHVLAAMIGELTGALWVQTFLADSTEHRDQSKSVKCVDLSHCVSTM